MDTEEELTPELVQEFVIAAHGNLHRVKEMYAAQPALLNVPWARFNETALGAAAHTGRREIAEYLLEAGAPLTVCAAAMLGQTAQVAAFLQADPSQANARGAHEIPILVHAAMSGQTEVCELLLEHGGGEGMDDALHGATLYGHTHIVAWLLAHGATDTNVRDFQGQTPRRVAADKGYTEIADLLERHGGALE